MTTAVSFEHQGYEYVLRFAYDPDLVAMVKTVPSFARSYTQGTKQWTVDAYYATRLAREMRGLGYLVTGLESESRKQQRNGDMYCSSRCRQRACYRCTRGRRAAK